MDGDWKRVASGREQASIALAAFPGEAERARVRSRSAAGVASGWRAFRLG